MALALSNRTFAEGALSGSTFTASVVRAAGESLLVWVVSKKNIGTADNISSVVWDPTGDNQTMTLVGSDTATYQGYRYSLYKLESPTSVKTGNVVVTFAGSSNTKAQISVEHWTGADTTTMTGTLTKSLNQVFTSSTPLSQTVSSAVGEIVTGFMSINDVPGGIAAASGQTNVVVQGAAAPAIGSSTKAGAASVTMGWTTTAQTTYENVWFIVPVKPASGGPATGVTLTGPTTGVTGVASSNFTVGVTPVGGTITGTVVVTPSDSGGGGTFSPTSVSLTSGSPTGTFTYTAASAGAKTISVTNNGSLTNPSNITYTASAAATAISVSGPSSGTTGVASTNFTVSANGAISGTVVVTPASAGGTFSPTTVSISSGSPTGTFTFTPSSTGAKTISFTNNGSLTNQADLTYTSNAAAVTGVTLTGPTSGAVSTASTNFTVGVSPVGGTITGTVVVTPSDASGGGTFSPTSVSLTSGSPTGTFTYTPASTGAKTISVSNNGSLSNPSNITYTVSASAGNFTSRPLVNDSGTVLASQAGWTALIYSLVNNALLATKTSLTTNSSGVLTYSDAACTAGTTYRVIYISSTGDEGMNKLVAT